MILLFPAPDSGRHNTSATLGSLRLFHTWDDTGKPTMLLMLEDDAARIERFENTLQAIEPELPLRVWRDAHVMIREVGPLLEAAQVISLDHDLESGPGLADPGNGLEVVKFLVAQPIVRPVIVHSSNFVRSRWMGAEFDLARWRHWRVSPLGQDWIEWDWRTIVEHLLDFPNAVMPA